MALTTLAQMNADRIYQEIEAARHQGTNLFLCGLIHNYSIKNPDGEWYLAIRGGKRLLPTSEVIHLIQPNVVLIEGYSPDDTYYKGVRQGFQDQWRPGYNSPELYELIDDVDKLGIRVRGCDLSRDEKHSFLHKLKFNKYWNLYKRLQEFLQERKEQITSDKRLKAAEEFLAKDYSYHDEYNANHIIRACKETKEIVTTLEEFFLEDEDFKDYNLFRNNAERMMKKWFEIRDTRAYETIMKEFRNNNRILVKIGLSHITKQWGYLPSLLKTTPYCSFINLQEHDGGDREVDS